MRDGGGEEACHRWSAVDWVVCFTVVVHHPCGLLSASNRYADRAGGYTRVLRTTNRKGDNAKMGIIELV